MFMGRILLLLGLGSALCLATVTARCAEESRNAPEFPLPANSYQDGQIPSVFGKLAARIQREPLNLAATIIFFAAIVHTFLTAQFRKIAHRYQRLYETIEESPSVMPDFRDSGKERDRLIFRAQVFSFMGEVEAVFGIWLVPLFIAIVAFHGCSSSWVFFSFSHLSRSLCTTNTRLQFGRHYSSASFLLPLLFTEDARNGGSLPFSVA
jgi:hypothetical protein